MKVSLFSRIVIVLAALAIPSLAQTFTSLISFRGGGSGINPNSSLVQGTDGNLYGTTQYGGRFGWGTVFKLTPRGVNTIYDFCSQSNCADGALPIGGLVLAHDGDFYGTTAEGGNPCPADITCGTIFKVSANGVFTSLHSFDGSDGETPIGPLLQWAGGELYGVTQSGGASDQGTVFKISTAGALFTLDSFNVTNGSSPDGPLIEGSGGKLNGTTITGGDGTCIPGGCGTVFDLSPSGALATRYEFNADDGSAPFGALAADLDGNLYGTTIEGGQGSLGTVFKLSGSALTTLYSFCSQSNCADGSSPYSGLISGTDGNFYGTTIAGGGSCAPPGCGTIYQITQTGVLDTLHSFDLANGETPFSGLFQATNGVFYGMTYQGGTFGAGTIYSLDMGIGPFVAFVSEAGQVGDAGGILGQGLSGTTSVALNGTPASFTVVSDTFIKATVPAGATTGYVTVTTPGGTLTSNVPFRVLP